MPTKTSFGSDINSWSIEHLILTRIHVDRFGKPVVFEENYFKHKRQTTPKSDYVGWNPNPAFR